MHIKVKNIGGIELADIASAGSIVLAAGRNGAGKTSLLRGVAGALTGELLPPGMKKASAGAIVQVEARHAAAIRLQNKQEPAPDAFDPSLEEAQVLKAVEPFIK